MRIGLLTGGGDCPGLNAVIRAVVRKAIDAHGDQVIGFRDGWRGVLENVAEELSLESTRGILPRGGTILGSSRTNPYARQDGVERVRQTLAAHRLDGLIPIGGEDTLGVANRLQAEGVRVIGVPKTIDNDLGGTDVTFGFDTALQIATEAIDRLHTTAESHHRILVVEVMGRTAGWIALHARVARGNSFDEFGHPRLGGIGYALEREIEERTGFETRATVLGHVQRGGTPTAFDRVLATRLGLAAIDAAHDQAWGTMVALRGNDIERVPLAEAVAEVRRVPVDAYARFGALFG